jgi:hypothetical protein
MAVHVSDLNHVFELFKTKFEIRTKFSKTILKFEKISKKSKSEK